MPLIINYNVAFVQEKNLDSIIDVIELNEKETKILDRKDINVETRIQKDKPILPLIKPEMR